MLEMIYMYIYIYIDIFPFENGMWDFQIYVRFCDVS